ALRDAEPAFDGLVEDAGDRGARVQAQRAADALEVRQARAQRQRRRADRAAGEAHRRAHGHRRAGASIAVEGARHHAARARAVEGDALDAAVGDHARAGLRRFGDQNLERVLLGVERAAQFAEARAHAADAVVAEQAAAPAELLD